LTSGPPQLPNTRLTRGWRKTLYDEVSRRRDRSRRLRRTLIAFALVDLVIVAGILVLVYRVTSTELSTHKPATVALPAFVTGRARRALAPTFVTAADESKVPVALLMALTWRESEWENDLVSGAGAVGIGQLLPPTSVFVARDLLHDPHLDPRRAVDNIRLTARYLAELIHELGGSQRLGVGAYLQGSTSVRSRGLTLETIAYVNQITMLRSEFAAAQQQP
jgi:soluble lytic murein transglycosylase-like protein